MVAHMTPFLLPLPLLQDKRRRTGAFMGSQQQQQQQKERYREPQSELVPNAMKLILSVPGNKHCADCTSTGELPLLTTPPVLC